VAAIDSVSVDDIVVDARRLENAIVDVLRGNGASTSDAASQAHVLVEGDLRGQHSHGVQRLPILVERLQKGLIVSGVEPEQTWVTDAVLRVDGGRGFGPAVAFEAVDSIIERAEQTGIALATVRNSNHVGMLAPYIERVAARNQIGIAMTTSEALVHPWGGARAMLGTNPLGIAVPTTGPPLVLDMSTASVSMGKILDFAVRSAPIPLGWAVDAHGQPTKDAEAAKRGAISPFGGPKGYALGIAFEAMVAILTESALGGAVRGTLDSREVANKGDLFFSISLARLELTALLPTLEAYLDEVRASAKDSDSEVFIPGDRARWIRDERLAAGIPLHPDVWAKTMELHGEATSA
jgi:LDH2 family malate/lactate/ureidoglycolate dehydrogenase